MKTPEPSRRRSSLLQAVRAGLAGPPPVGATEHLLVAVSGGPDSVALLLALAAEAPAGGWRLTAAHVDHGLRSRDGAAERDAVARLAASLDVPLVQRRLALAPGPGLEARARAARRRTLVEMASDTGATRIVLGHTADDQAETVVLRLLRGAGRGGLAGMRRARGRLLRPLLTATRADVRRFLTERAAGFALDRSNADLRHARNRVRRLVLPLLAAEFNPGLVRGLAALAARLRDEDDLLEALASERHAALASEAGLRVDVAAEPAALARRIVRRWLEAGARRGVGAQHVERVLALAAATGRGAVAVPGPFRVVRDRTHLVRHTGRAPDRSPFALPIEPGECVTQPALGWRLALSRPGPPPSPAATTGGDPCRVMLDAAVLARPLVLRSRRPGDRVHLPGGTRKLQDVLVDARVPREARDRVPILAAGGEIVWVPGVVCARGAVAGPGTATVVYARYERIPPA